MFFVLLSISYPNYLYICALLSHFPMLSNCICVGLSVYLTIYIIYLNVSLIVCLFHMLSNCIFVGLFVNFKCYLSLRISCQSSANLKMSESTYLTTNLSICLFRCISLHISICPPVYLNTEPELFTVLNTILRPSCCKRHHYSTSFMKD